MIKLIAFDIDGTLIAQKRMVPEENIKAIRRAREAGIKIAIATGRSKHGIQSVAEQIEAITGEELLIGYNGGAVYRYFENGKHEMLSEKTFKPSEVKEIFEIAKKYRMKVIAYVKDRDFIFSNRRFGFFVWWMQKRAKLKSQLYKSKKFDDTFVYKLICFGKNKKTIKFRDEMAALNHETYAFSYVHKANRNVEVNPHGVSKAYGLEQIGKIYNIKPEEMMFFGDGENDIQALEYAGYGYAMENASEEVKKHAKFICGHHMDAAPSKVINEYLDSQGK